MTGELFIVVFLAAIIFFGFGLAGLLAIGIDRLLEWLEPWEE